jgi:hypothetical protein
MGLRFLTGRRVAGVRCGVAVAAVFFALTGAAAADDHAAQDAAAQARQQYQAGMEAFQAKRYDEAGLHFEAAAASRSNAVALYTAGLSWDLAAKPERAADAYARALAIGGLESKQDALAKDRVGQLEKSLGTLLVMAPDGWRVQLEGFTEVLTPARLHAVMGTRTLTVRAPGKPADRREVSLEASKVSTLDLKEEAKLAKPSASPSAGADDLAVATPAQAEAASGMSEPPPVDTSRNSFWIPRRVVGAAVAGVGVAALGGGIFLGLEANRTLDQYNANPTREGYDRATSYQTWTNVAFIAGGALLVGGVVLVVWPRGHTAVRPDVAFHVAPQGAGLTGTF